MRVEKPAACYDHDPYPIGDVYDELEPDYTLLRDDDDDEYYLYVSSSPLLEDHLLPEELFDYV